MSYILWRQEGEEIYHEIGRILTTMRNPEFVTSHRVNVATWINLILQTNIFSTLHSSTHTIFMTQVYLNTFLKAIVMSKVLFMLLLGMYIDIQELIGKYTHFIVAI